jgi:hypothetical protein
MWPNGATVRFVPFVAQFVRSCDGPLWFVQIATHITVRFLLSFVLTVIVCVGCSIFLPTLLILFAGSIPDGVIRIFH